MNKKIKNYEDFKNLRNLGIFTVQGTRNDGNYCEVARIVISKFRLFNESSN